MKLIYKYQIPVTESALVPMLEGATILNVGIQGNQNIVVWAAVDPNAQEIGRRFHVRGTGHEMPPETARYLGTVYQPPMLYLHVFDGGEG